MKLYHLNEEGKWDDKGTGHVACIVKDKTVENAVYYLVMHSEEDDRILLESRVSDDDIYQQQGDTLIVWNDVDSGTEMALSFAQPIGCSEIWHEIELAQQSYRGRSTNGLSMHRRGSGGASSHLISSEYDEISDEFGVDISDSPLRTGNGAGSARGNGDNGSQVVALPDPELQNLSKIEEFIFEISPTLRKEKVSSLLLTNNYLRKLLDVFIRCEDVEDIQSLRRFSHISRGIVSLNEPTLFETLTSDEYFSDFIGTLEYDPELPLNSNSSHRTLFQASSRFKKLFSFADSGLLTKIHCNFRLQFLRDVVLARFLEDSTLTTLNSLIYFSNVDIVSGVMDDDKFLDNMFHLINSENPPSDELKNTFLFLQELNSLAKNLQPNRKSGFFKILISKGLLDVLERFCTHQDLKIRQSVSDMMNSLICHDPNHLRSWLISESQKKNDYPFFRNLVTQFVRDPDTGMKAQLTEILRTLLETETIAESGIGLLPRSGGGEKDEVLNVFYSNLLDLLVSVITDDPDTTETLPCEDKPQTQHYICDLLSFFVQHHGYRIKFFVLRKNLCGKVLRLLQSPDKHLALAAIHFFRSCASLKDDFYNRYFIRHKLFDPIIEVFKANGSRYNLINSTIIELFDFIRKNNITTLIEHLVEKYRDFFNSITYVDVFKGLITQYEQNKLQEESILNRSSTSSMSDASPRQSNKRLRLDEDDDEAYFNEDDDEENTSIHSDEGSASPTSRGSPSSPLSPSMSSSPSPPTSLTPIISSSLLLSPAKKKPRLVEFGDDDCMPSEREPPGCSF